MSKALPNGSTRLWRRLRTAILTRDGRRCQLQIPGICTTIATEVHHTIGAAGGTNPAHLVAACRPCNRRVGNPENADPKQRPRSRTQW